MTGRRHLFRLLLALLAIGTLSLVWRSTNLSLLDSSTSDEERAHAVAPVCLVGRAGSKEEAVRLWRWWDSSFPAVFWLSSTTTTTTADRSAALATPPGLTVLLWPRFYGQAGKKLNKQETLYEAYHHAASMHHCEYYLYLSEDVAFTSSYESRQDLGEREKEEGRPTSSSPSAALVQLLERWKPAVASFGNLTHSETNGGVAPLVRGLNLEAFLVHRSLAGLVFEAGEDQELFGGWTLSSLFGMHVIPALLEEHSLDFLSFTVNKFQASSLFLRNEHSSVGALMNSVSWKLSSVMTLDNEKNDEEIARVTRLNRKPATNVPSDFKPTFLKRMNEEYRLNNVLLGKRFLNAWKSVFPRLPFASFHKPSFVINVILTNDKDKQGKGRLWRSLEAAERIPYSVSIHVFSCSTESPLLPSFPPSRHGTIYVHTRTFPTEDCWNPTQGSEFALFLRDDQEVSPFFLRWLAKAVETYFLGESYDPHLSGVSLYSIPFEGRTESTVGTPLLVQHSMEWGVLWDGQSWNRFQRWYQQKRDASNKRSSMLFSEAERRGSNGDMESWRRDHVRFIEETRRMVLMPNPPNGLSFVSSLYLDSFVNENDKVPLLKQTEDMNLLNWPRLETLQVFDSNFRRVVTQETEEEIENEEGQGEEEHKEQGQQELAEAEEDGDRRAMSTLPSDAANPNRCTLVMPVFSRIDSFTDRLQHYTGIHNVIGQILIVWNNLDQPPPLNSSSFTITSSNSTLSFIFNGVPVTIKRMPRNSLNNRFLPFNELQNYDCVLHMDDDTDFPAEALTTELVAWMTHPRSMVNVRERGRSHAVEADTGRLFYSSTHGAFVSIVLPSGLMLHKDYHAMYSDGSLQEARQLVDSFMNCEDILMNFVVANATGRPPVIVDVSIRKALIRKLGKSGVSAKDDHYERRNTCIRLLGEMFGGIPLRYAEHSFSANSSVDEAHNNFDQFLIMKSNSKLVLSPPNDLDLPPLCLECIHYGQLFHHHEVLMSSLNHTTLALPCDLLQTPHLCQQGDKRIRVRRRMSGFRCKSKKIGICRKQLQRKAMANFVGLTGQSVASPTGVAMVLSFNHRITSNVLHWRHCRHVPCSFTPIPVQANARVWQIGMFNSATLFKEKPRQQLQMAADGNDLADALSDPHALSRSHLN
ncbi:glycosyltransferase family protein 64 C3 [Balamuthia mandrillaris]